MYIKRFDVKTYDFAHDENFQYWFQTEILQGKYQPNFDKLYRKARRDWVDMLNHQDN